MRRTIVAGNWKMFKTVREANAFADAFLPLVPSLPETVDIVVCPPFTALERLCARFSGTRVAVGAQNMYWEGEGAFTGEISPPMLAELGVTYVILGHSERRQYFGESDDGVRRKVVAALTHGLTPIVAVGETLQERDAGLTRSRVVEQTRRGLHGIGFDGAAKVVMAYEPVWAIGTGRNCDANDADVVMSAIRESVDGLANAPILYGGSVKPENVARYAAQPQIDGALVGGASLQAASFADVIRASAKVAA